MPTGVSAAAGDGQATISFTAPASDGGSTITGYTVTSNPGGFTGTGAASPITVTGLTNGTAYTFTVTATNSIGTGSASSASAAVTPVGVPGMPTGVSAAAGDGQATISFTAPASDGGSAITGYTVTSNPGGFTGTGAASPITITGLTNGTAYTFTVTATSSQGTGAASSASTAVTPATIPGVPTGVSATVGDGQATISFTAPASDGGSAITGYTVTSNPGGFTGTGAASPITITGLTNGTAYTFTVTATNSQGTGAASSASTAVTPIAEVINSPTPTPIPTPTPVVDEITVDVKQGETDNIAARITIERTTDGNGNKSDTVTFDAEKAAETSAKMVDSSEEFARIIIPDADDEVSETMVKVPTDAIEVLAKGNIGLQIDTEDAKLNISPESMQTASENTNKDLYFNLVPVKNDEVKNELTERAIAQARIVSENSQSSINVVGVPVAIETNMPSTAVNITIPLTRINLPTGSAEREAYLNQLAVYIEHSDGTKELVKGKIVEYKAGVLGIEFHITKFSTFTIVQTDVFTNQTKSASCDVVKVITPGKAIIKGTEINATVENKVSSIAIRINVSDKAVWDLYSDKACMKILADHKLKLKTGRNNTYIKVTAEDGTAKIYKLNITRSKSTAATITNVTVPEKAVIKDKVLTASVANNIDTIVIKLATSKNATWKLYSDKACKKALTNTRMKLSVGVNTIYVKVTAENGTTSNLYTLKVTREAAPEKQYNTHVKFGVIGSKDYAEKIVNIIKQDYEHVMVNLVEEGKYSRIYVDFADKATAKKVCNDLVDKRYIINYYFYTK
jgi:hypothetical protein